MKDSGEKHETMNTGMTWWMVNYIVESRMGVLQGLEFLSERFAKIE
jgi:hypothetical protein